MCIICVKNKGVDAPTIDNVESMFFANPHGAGFAYLDGDKIKIQKGYMNVDDLLNALETVYNRLGNRLKNTPFIYHFRITTSGGTNAGLTHPFPLTNKTVKLTKTAQQTDVAIAHNGIIDIDIEHGLSDTATYVKTELYPFKGLNRYFYKSKQIQDAIYHRITSKLAILDLTGDITTIGAFESDETGLLYSNDSYKPFTGFCGDLYNDAYYYGKQGEKFCKKPKKTIQRVKSNYELLTTTGYYNNDSSFVQLWIDVDSERLYKYNALTKRWYDCGFVVDFYNLYDDGATAITILDIIDR